MKRTGKSSSWISSNYDKLSVVVVLVLIVVSAGFLAVSVNKERAAIDQAKNMPPALGREATAYDLGTYSSLKDLAANPKVAAPATNLFLVSELRVESVNSKGVKAPIPYDAEVCPFTNEPQPRIQDRDSDGDGIPDWWEEKHGLDPLNPEDARLDTDGDGFTNLEEYTAEPRTDPADTEAHPPVSSKLRLIQVKTVPFRMRFDGVQQLAENQTRFLINMSNRSYFSKLGDEIEGFKVAHFDEIIESREEHGVMRRIDRSVITLTRGGKQWKLRINESGSADEHYAHLINLMDRAQYELPKDGKQIIRGVEYQVVEIRQNMVVLRDVKAGTEVQIGLLTQDERALLSGRDPYMESTDGYDGVMPAYQPAPAMPARPYPGNRIPPATGGTGMNRN